MHPSSEKVIPLNLNNQKARTNHMHQTHNPSLPTKKSVRFPQADRTPVQLPIPPQSTDDTGYGVIKLSELH